MATCIGVCQKCIQKFWIWAGGFLLLGGCATWGLGPSTWLGPEGAEAYSRTRRFVDRHRQAWGSSSAFLALAAVLEGGPGSLHDAYEYIYIYRRYIHIHTLCVYVYVDK